MIVYGDWKRVVSVCVNCNAPLESRPVHKSGFYLDGLEPMQYRHTGGGCYNPEVYSGWNKKRDWDRASVNKCRGKRIKTELKTIQRQMANSANELDRLSAMLTRWPHTFLRSALMRLL